MAHSSSENPSDSGPTASTAQSAVSNKNANHPPRNIILCFDGTGNKFDDSENTNVVRLFRALKKKDSSTEQITYYQAGIGTYFKKQTLFPSIWSMFDEALALHVEERIKEGYRFIMQSYRDGDKIFMFGFSRGAYIARALCGMIHKVGILPPHNEEQLDFALSVYRDLWKRAVASAAGPSPPMEGYTGFRLAP